MGRLPRSVVAASRVKGLVFRVENLGFRRLEGFAEWGWGPHDLGLDTRSIVTIYRLFERCRYQDITGHLHVSRCFVLRSNARARTRETKQRPCKRITQKRRPLSVFSRGNNGRDRVVRSISRRRCHGWWENGKTTSQLQLI